MRRLNISTALGEALAERGVIHQPPLGDDEKAVANADTLVSGSAREMSSSLRTSPGRFLVQSSHLLTEIQTFNKTGFASWR